MRTTKYAKQGHVKNHEWTRMDTNVVPRMIQNHERHEPHENRAEGY